MRIGLFRLRMVAGPLVGLGVALGATSPIYAEPPSAPSADQRAAAASSLQKKFQDLSASYQKLPRDTFDPAAVIEQVGRDPDNLLKWVREQTSWVPYRGCLRGASGVLMDRVGNSLDRSVLLCDLLKSAGFSVRLARADLSEEQARPLLNLAPAPVRGEAPTDVSPATAEARKRVLAQAESIAGLLGAPPGAADAQADAFAAAR